MISEIRTAMEKELYSLFYDSTNVGVLALCATLTYMFLIKNQVSKQSLNSQLLAYLIFPL